MSLDPRTVYVVSCDSCGVTYYAQDLEDDEYELTLPTQQLDPAWARRMTAEGWIVTTRHLCPACVQTRGTNLMERLELERTNAALFDLPVHRPPSTNSGETDPGMTDNQPRTDATAAPSAHIPINSDATAAAPLTGDHPSDQPTIVCLCGSTRFWADLAEANLRETAAGRIVLAPGCDMKRPHPLWSDPQRAEELKQQLDDLHRWKIRAADEVLVVNPGGYIGDSTRAEIRFAHELGRPVRYTDPLGYAVILTRPELDPVRLGPYEHEHQAEDVAAGLRRQMHNTQHVEGTTIAVGDYAPDRDHLAARVVTDPYALAEAMDDDPGGDGTGRNFPDLYARLIAQEGYDRAAELWGKACHAYDYLHHGPDDDA